MRENSSQKGRSCLTYFDLVLEAWLCYFHHSVGHKSANNFVEEEIETTFPNRSVKVILRRVCGMQVNFVVKLENTSPTLSEFLTWCFAKGGCSVNVCKINEIKAVCLKMCFNVKDQPNKFSQMALKYTAPTLWNRYSCNFKSFKTSLTLIRHVNNCVCRLALGSSIYIICGGICVLCCLICLH